MLLTVQTRLPSRYRLIEEVGQGGMAVVYRAQDETLKREVAVKVLHAHLCAEPESKTRLEREARAVAKLRHDNILQIFDYSGVDSPSAFIVTEFIDGQNLKQFFAKRKIGVPEVGALIAMEVGEALSHAHSLGILHRDIKPENVMVRKDGAIKLMDFGVAQILDLERLTVTGQLLGSPAYMAPETLEGKQIDFRTDVFSTGVLLYQLTTGVLPFSGRNPHEVLKKIAEGRFADPRTINRLISDRLARIISRALSREPQGRHPDVQAFIDDLRGYVADAGIESPKEHLARYFVDPDRYEKEIIPELVKGLVSSGKREHAGKHLARALEAWNRVLAYDPQNPDVLRQLRWLEGRRRARHVVVAAGGTLLLAGLIGGAFRIAGQSEPAKVASAPVQVGGAGLPGGAENGTAKRPPPPPSLPVRPSRPPALPLEPRRPAVAEKVRVDSPAATPTVTNQKRPTARKAASKVRFTLGPKPPKVEVWVDGVNQGMFGPRLAAVELDWDGPHTIEFRNDDCCKPFRTTVGPNTFRPPHDHLTGVLEPKIATLTVLLSPPREGVRLLVIEKTKGKQVPWKTPVRPGEEVAVPFDPTDEIRKNLDVVAIDGEHTQTRSLVVTAGSPHSFTVKLDK